MKLSAHGYEKTYHCDGDAEYQHPFQEPDAKCELKSYQAANDFKNSQCSISDIIRLQGYLITGGRVFNPGMSDA